jgi:hypothetical protein
VLLLVAAFQNEGGLMISFHRRAILRDMLGSGALLPAASLMPKPIEAQSNFEAQSYTFGPGFNYVLEAQNHGSPSESISCDILRRARWACKSSL